MTGEVAPTPESDERVRERKSFELLSVLVEKVTGTVKWFSVSRRYGFIHRDDNNEDVFVHRTAIAASKQRFPSLKTGEPVEFSVVETKSGINAASVTGPGGKPVKGYWHFFNSSRPKSQSESAAAPPNLESTPSQNEVQAGGDMQPVRRRNFRGRRRWSERRAPRTSQESSGDIATQTDINPEEGVSPTGDEPRLRPYPRRRRGRSLGNMLDNAGSRPLPAGEGGAVNQQQQQRPPGRFRRPFRRGGGRRSFNGTRPPRPADADSAVDEHKAFSDEEHPIEKEMEKMTIETSPTESEEVAKLAAESPDVKTPNADELLASGTGDDDSATNEEKVEGDLIGKSTI